MIYHTDDTQMKIAKYKVNTQKQNKIQTLKYKKNMNVVAWWW